MDKQIKALFLRIAALIEKDSCSLCRAQDNHEQCEHPNIASAIKQAVEELNESTKC